MPDRWDGEEHADAAREAYAQSYARAAAAGRADDLPLDPESRASGLATCQACCCQPNRSLSTTSFRAAGPRDDVPQQILEVRERDHRFLRTPAPFRGRLLRRRARPGTRIRRGRKAGWVGGAPRNGRPRPTHHPLSPPGCSAVRTRSTRMHPPRRSSSRGGQEPHGLVCVRQLRERGHQRITVSGAVCSAEGTPSSVDSGGSHVTRLPASIRWRVGRGPSFAQAAEQSLLADGHVVAPVLAHSSVDSFASIVARPMFPHPTRVSLRSRGRSLTAAMPMIFLQYWMFTISSRWRAASSEMSPGSEVLQPQRFQLGKHADPGEARQRASPINPSRRSPTGSTRRKISSSVGTFNRFNSSSGVRAPAAHCSEISAGRGEGPELGEVFVLEAEGFADVEGLQVRPTTSGHT